MGEDKESCEIGPSAAVGGKATEFPLSITPLPNPIEPDRSYPLCANCVPDSRQEVPDGTEEKANNWTRYEFLARPRLSRT